MNPTDIAHARRTWKKPELIVLGRGTPEEMALLKCKNQSQTACDEQANYVNAGKS